MFVFQESASDSQIGARYYKHPGMEYFRDLLTSVAAICIKLELAGNPWNCIFGCADSRDEVVHYLSCPMLWDFAREALKIQEDSIFIGSRLCLVEPSMAKLKLIAFVHSLYHALENDPNCMGQDGLPVSSNLMQIAPLMSVGP